MKTSIRTRLLLFLILSYIPIAIILLVNHETEYTEARQEVEERALQQAREVALVHQQQFQELEDVLRLLAQTHMIQAWDMELCRQRVPAMASQFASWSSIAVMDTDGTVVCSNLPEAVGQNFADLEFVRTALETGEVTFSGLITGRVTGELNFAVVMPIVDEAGQTRGLIAIGIVPDLQSAVVAREVLRPGYRLTVVDGNNTVLMGYPEPERWIGQQYNGDVLQAIQSQSEGTLEAQGLDGSPRLFGFTRVEPAEATVLVSIEESTAFAGLSRIQQQTALLLGLTFTTTALLTALASRFIARPLNRVAQVTNEFADDLTRRIVVDSTIDEIRLIQQAFNKMADSIEGYVTERVTALKEVNKELAEEVQTRKEIETALEQSAVRLRESNRDLEQFAYVASHDLREPLRKIIAFTDRLRRNNLPDEQRRDYTNRVYQAVKHLIEMIDNLLIYARMDEQPDMRTNVQLKTVVNDVLADLDPLLKETQGSVAVGSLPTIQADKVQMHRLFHNMIANALKYHQEGVPPVVKVTAQETEQELQIRIEDNGVGIEERDRERVFLIFERLHGKSQGGGTGIGLAICRKIMQHHKGEITIESRVGRGTTFVLHFPLSIKVEGESRTMSNM